MDEDVYVIEVNPRSSRTVPYISKVTGIPIVPLATKVIYRKDNPRNWAMTPGLAADGGLYCHQDAGILLREDPRRGDISLGPEMKSTGECLGIAKTFNEALI